MLPTDPKERKDTPIFSGVLKYFPLALAEIARASKAGNDQHNPGQPLHWDKSKSTDHADCIIRHLIDAGSLDTDGIRHSAKCAWRSLALLQMELENEKETHTIPIKLVEEQSLSSYLRSATPATKEELEAQRQGMAKYTPGERQARMIP